MGQMLIRNLDDAVIAKLKDRAARHRSSVEAEARRVLTQGVGAGIAEWKARLEAVRAMIGPPSGPDSTELLRQDRDRDLP